MKKVVLVILLTIIVLAGYFVLRSNTSMMSIPSDRVAYTGNGVQFFYPATFGAHVWRVDKRPPVVTVVPANKDAIAVGCPMLKDSATITESWGGEINGVSYWFYQWWDIGAGTLYTSKCYIFSGENKNYVIDFEIRSHSWCENGNCWAYCGTEFEQECKDFAMGKDVDRAIERIISTLKIQP